MNRLSHLTYRLLLYCHPLQMTLLIFSSQLMVLMTFATFATLATGQITSGSLTQGQQQISFGMRKLAFSSNQFGIDLFRSMDQTPLKTAVCPFCIFSSLSMMLIGATGSTSSALRHALYLWGMQSEEISMATYDLMNHLGVNLPPHSLFSDHLASTGARVGPMFNSSFPITDLPLSHTMSGMGGLGALGGLGGMSGLTSSSALVPPPSTSDIAFMCNIYVQRDFPINYHYHMLLQRFYKTVIHPLDFHFNGEETRQHINAIVSKQTLGKINNILPDLKSPATQMLLLSALYFKGTLDLNLLDVSSTSSPPETASSQLVNSLSPTTPGPNGHEMTSAAYFNQPQNSTSPWPSEAPSVRFSHQQTPDTSDDVMLQAHSARLRYKLDPYLNATTVELPFKNSLLTLLLMMPGDSNLDMLLTRLSAQVLLDVVNSLQVKKLNIKMPRLHLHYSSGNLTWPLSNLGLGDLFKPGFSHLHGISEYKWLAVSDIISTSHLDIKETAIPHSNVPYDVHLSTSTTTQSPLSGHFYSSSHGHTPQQQPSPSPPQLNHHQPQPPQLQQQYLQQQQHQQYHQPHQQQEPQKQHQHQQYQQQQQQPPASTLHQHGEKDFFAHPFSPLNHNAIKYPLYGIGHRIRQKPSRPGVKGRGDTNDAIDVTFNKPFIYFVIDTVSGLIMAMGKVGREPVTYRLPI